VIGSHRYGTVRGVKGLVFLLVLSSCGGFLGRKEMAPPGVIAPAPPLPAPQAKDQTPRPESPVVEQVGVASWYGPGFHGQETASGERFDQNQLTAAHRTLPLGTTAVVTNLETGKSVKVKITDRGPYVKGRKIDLSRAAARKLGMTKKGVAKVKITATPRRKTKKKPARRPTKRPSVQTADGNLQPANAVGPKTNAP
jgi:rare lipoprotein A (peptidoglycan hydrolase)